ncbi:MAG: septal ring lytic transglycosylase RlpA family protein [Elainella sp. Prado103]|jgi:rare lipoprotein A|nr:septal ring lytic transglycosylase RlpA family protein [Elainella sp. Prado103]
MNQKLFSGITAALMISTFGLVPSGLADQARTSDEPSREQVPGISATSEAATAQTVALESLATTQSAISRLESSERSDRPEESPADRLEHDASADFNGSHANSGADAKISSPVDSLGSPSQVATNSETTVPGLVTSPAESQSTDTVKVGEYQSQEEFGAEVSVATIQSHPLRNRQAATLYVRNIPVLSFLGQSIDTAHAVEASLTGAEVKIASVQAHGATAMVAPVGINPVEPSEPTQKLATAAPAVSQPPIDSRDPVWRATTTAARLNQLHRDGINASEIKISWDADRKQYVIQANDTEILALDADTVLPDTVGSAAGDVLQATNRIRRQMGNAAPLSSIEGDPDGYGQISLGPVNLQVSGYASWYGPGFDGNYSASGEIFNQNAMTAAHPSLPFGTEVRVTNLDNGQSVVVRINDRGPYSHGRVIDLSAGAARIIGLISSGVAPVSLEVLGTVRSVDR